jgi:lysophospholipase L1-like esterase
VMNDAGVMIDDLHALVAAQPIALQRLKDVHFTEAGYRRLGEAVTASVAAVLPSARR